MAEWDPEQYLQFKKDRLRPAIDLLERVKIDELGYIVDLGCGPATSTRLLGERFPDAKIVGIDNSPQMIVEAAKTYREAEYILCELEEWRPEANVDLLFANAVFHWLTDHGALIKRLAAMLLPDGVLAFQMPDNLSEPSHRAIAELVNLEEWKDVIGGNSSSRGELGSINRYYDWMAQDFHHIDIWRTTYAHVMPSHQHIVEWIKGAALTPYLGKMSDKQKAKFLEAYELKIRKFYPTQTDGTVIFHFPRLFVVGCKNR